MIRRRVLLSHSVKRSTNSFCLSKNSEQKIPFNMCPVLSELNDPTALARLRRGHTDSLVGSCSKLPDMHSASTLSLIADLSSGVRSGTKKRASTLTRTYSSRRILDAARTTPNFEEQIRLSISKMNFESAISHVPTFKGAAAPVVTRSLIDGLLNSLQGTSSKNSSTKSLNVVAHTGTYSAQSRNLSRGPHMTSTLSMSNMYVPVNEAPDDNPVSKTRYDCVLSSASDSDSGCTASTLLIAADNGMESDPSTSLTDILDGAVRKQAPGRRETVLSHTASHRSLHKNTTSKRMFLDVAIDDLSDDSSYSASRNPIKSRARIAVCSAAIRRTMSQNNCLQSCITADELTDGSRTLSRKAPSRLVCKRNRILPQAPSSKSLRHLKLLDYDDSVPYGTPIFSAADDNPASQNVPSEIYGTSDLVAAQQCFLNNAMTEMPNAPPDNRNPHTHDRTASSAKEHLFSTSDEEDHVLRQSRIRRLFGVQLPRMTAEPGSSSATQAAQLLSENEPLFTRDALSAILTDYEALYSGLLQNSTLRFQRISERSRSVALFGSFYTDHLYALDPFSISSVSEDDQGSLFDSSSSSDIALDTDYAQCSDSNRSIVDSLGSEHSSFSLPDCSSPPAYREKGSRMRRPGGICHSSSKDAGYGSLVSNPHLTHPMSNLHSCDRPHPAKGEISVCTPSFHALNGKSNSPAFLYRAYIDRYGISNDVYTFNIDEDSVACFVHPAEQIIENRRANWSRFCETRFFESHPSSIFAIGSPTDTPH